MPANYNALKGYGMNPYDPRRDPREAHVRRPPGAAAPADRARGSGPPRASGRRTSGTETSGSILSPANQNMLVAIKPTVGRISRYGVIPITADQDTAGPMARTRHRRRDPAGRARRRRPRSQRRGHQDAARRRRAATTRGSSNPRGLQGRAHRHPARLLLRQGDAARARRSRAAASTTNRRRSWPRRSTILKQQGAVIVDPADIPSVVATDATNNFLSWGICGGLDNAKGKDADCSVVFKYGMKRDFNAWLATPGRRGAGQDPDRAAPVERRASEGGRHQVRPGPARHLGRDGRARRTARATRPTARRTSASRATEGIDAAMKKHNLDALLFPGASGAGDRGQAGLSDGDRALRLRAQRSFRAAAARRRAADPFPPGFDAKPAPFGVSFTGMACSEPRLIELAYAFEQATKRRVPPASAP